MSMETCHVRDRNITWAKGLRCLNWKRFLFVETLQKWCCCLLLLCCRRWQKGGRKGCTCHHNSPQRLCTHCWRAMSDKYTCLLLSKHGGKKILIFHDTFYFARILFNVFYSRLFFTSFFILRSEDADWLLHLVSVYVEASYLSYSLILLSLFVH